MGPWTCEWEFAGMTLSAVERLTHERCQQAHVQYAGEQRDQTDD
jgi:hypothetical protein